MNARNLNNKTIEYINLTLEWHWWMAVNVYVLFRNIYFTMQPSVRYIVIWNRLYK